jgi:metal-responsive CopG/Arc/MetJ family transcriptional regulator
MRTIIELPDEQLRALDRLRRRLGISRAEAIRRALRGYLADEAVDEGEADPAFGLWSARGDAAAADLRRLRDEWDERPATGGVR